MSDELKDDGAGSASGTAPSVEPVKLNSQFTANRADDLLDHDRGAAGVRSG